MQATARRLSVVSSTSCARRRLIRDVRPTNEPLEMPEVAPIDQSIASVPRQAFRWRFCLLSVLPPTALYLMASWDECCMGTPWIEIAVCITLTLICGGVIGLIVPATSRYAARIGYLSPFVPALLLAVGVVFDASRERFSLLSTIGIMLGFPFFYYLLMLPTAGFYFLTHQLRRTIACRP